MKKRYILFAILALLMIQFSCVRVVNAISEGNVDLDPSNKDNIYNNVESADATTYSCGNAMVSDIPGSILDTVHIAYMVIQVVVPVILVVMGMVTLLKSVTSSKEDEIKKAQMGFVKKLITGALVFFVFVIVKLLISFAATSDRSPKIVDCMDCFLNGKDKCSGFTKEDRESVNNFVQESTQFVQNTVNAVINALNKN